MARNLLKAGFEITVHNRTRSKEKPLVALGAERADSPAEAARGADLVITIVSDIPDVEDVILGHSGALAGARPGSLIADMSTIGPKAACRLAEACSGREVGFLDAPVSGGTTGAEQGTLSIMVGGPEEALKKARPAFEALGKTIVHCGPTGSGQAVKLVNQIVGIIGLSGVAEGLTFAERMGLDVDATIQAVGGGAASSWMLNTLGPRMAASDYEGFFKVKLQKKDLRIALEEADELGIPLVFTGLVQQFLTHAENLGHGEHGTQSIIDVFRRINSGGA